MVRGPATEPQQRLGGLLPKLSRTVCRANPGAAAGEQDAGAAGAVRGGGDEKAGARLEIVTNTNPTIPTFYFLEWILHNLTQLAWGGEGSHTKFLLKWTENQVLSHGGHDWLVAQGTHLVPLHEGLGSRPRPPGQTWSPTNHKAINRNVSCAARKI